MAADESVLTRKLRQAGVARSPLPDTALIGEALARRSEDRLRAIVAGAVTFRVGDCRVSRLGDATMEIGTPSMIGLLTLAGAETPAILAIDSALAWHLTDVTLGGDPAQASAVTVRSFTGIDLALGRLHLQALVGALGDALEAALGRVLPDAFDLAEQRQTISQVRLAPDYVDVLRIWLEGGVGDAGRSGRVDIVIPLATLDVIRAAAAREGAAEAKDRPDDLWRAAMRHAAATAPVPLDAVIHRERMSLAAIERLRPGQMIEIDPDAPRQVALIIAQPGGRVATIAEAKLGAHGEMKVIRLNAPPEPRLALHVRKALEPAASPALGAEPKRARLPPPEPD